MTREQTLEDLLRRIQNMISFDDNDYPDLQLFRMWKDIHGEIEKELTGLRPFVLAYTQTLDGEEESHLIFHCEAENYEHAVEQLNNAIESEDEKVVWVEEVGKK